MLNNTRMMHRKMPASGPHSKPSQPQTLLGLSHHASGESAWICPGQTVSVQIAGQGMWGDAAFLRFDGIEAALRRGAPGVFRAVVPYGLRVSHVTCVELGGGAGEPLRIPVLSACPGLYTANGGGDGQALANNEDGSPNSAGYPARPGSVLTLFGTGEGITDPSSDGHSPAPAEPWLLPRPILPVRVTVGSAAAPLIYAGAIAGETPGRFQMLIEVPELAPGEHEVIVWVGGFASRAGVTVEVGSARYSPQ